MAETNIISLWNNFDSLSQMIKDTTDILLVSEAKIVSSFATAQFYINGFTTYRRDRNKSWSDSSVY